MRSGDMAYVVPGGANRQYSISSAVSHGTSGVVHAPLAPSNRYPVARPHPVSMKLPQSGGVRAAHAASRSTPVDEDCVDDDDVIPAVGADPVVEDVCPPPPSAESDSLLLHPTAATTARLWKASTWLSFMVLGSGGAAIPFGH